ncbi:MAG: Rab family GTPase [Bacteroidota bacterium]
MLGHFGVGKTSLIRRYVEDSFSDNYKVSIGVHITKKVVEITANDSMSLIIWDLEGTDDVNNVRQSYLLGTHGAIYVFDVTRPSTFQDIHKDLTTIREKMPNTPLLVVGNKVDMVILSELEPILKKHAIIYNFLTSAKTGDMVNDLFHQLATVLYNNAKTI